MRTFHGSLWRKSPLTYESTADHCIIPGCTKVFSTKSNMQRHLFTHHSVEGRDGNRDATVNLARVPDLERTLPGNHIINETGQADDVQPEGASVTPLPALVANGTRDAGQTETGV